ncbi:acyltransferase [Sphingobacterium faecium]|jgi:acetyltransferase-like isoleucine patch superfamily enzyme|uniref:acyltransferase n=1 Tax=Sphingobacterium faecium TaxID=34087 RepID=UPI00320B52D0
MKQYIYQNKSLKHLVHWLIMSPTRTRPRWYVRMLQFLYVKRGRGSVIYNSVRRDLVPFRQCSIGMRSVVESFSVLNNAVGDLHIGDHTRIGIGNTIIGPVTIGHQVNIGQHVLISGLNHRYEDVQISIAEQGVSVAPVTIADDVWIGGNVVILAGIRIGQHAVIGAGSVVTRDVPAYSVALGNPAKVVKTYDFNLNCWVKV